MYLVLMVGSSVLYVEDLSDALMARTERDRGLHRKVAQTVLIYCDASQLKRTNKCKS